MRFIGDLLLPFALNSGTSIIRTTFWRRVPFSLSLSLSHCGSLCWNPSAGEVYLHFKLFHITALNRKLPQVHDADADDDFRNLSSSSYNPKKCAAKVCQRKFTKEATEKNVESISCHHLSNEDCISLTLFNGEKESCNHRLTGFSFIYKARTLWNVDCLNGIVSLALVKLHIRLSTSSVSFWFRDN